MDSWDLQYGVIICLPGMGVVATSAFSILTMLIAIPTSQNFQLIGTMWGGVIRFTIPMLLALGFITMLMIVIYGIMHSSVPIDAQHQDSYFVVAHFHYVLIGEHYLDCSDFIIGYRT